MVEPSMRLRGFGGIGRLLGGLLLMLATFALPAAAEDFRPAKGSHWVALASSRDADTAIGIARLYGDAARVVLSRNGWYAAVLDPRPGTIDAIRADAPWPGLPADALLSEGGNYRQTIWQPSDARLAEATVHPNGQATVRSGGLTVSITRSSREDSAEMRLVGRERGKLLFDVRHRFEGDSDSESKLTLAELDFGNGHPEVLFDVYTGGAHCCMETAVLTEREGGKWSLVDLGTSDGGIWLEDVDGNGTAEIMSQDDGFLYVFAPYSNSRRPLIIAEIRDGEIDDISADDSVLPRQRQALAGMEYEASKVSPELWHDNGFLAAWVATKALLGEGAEALHEAGRLHTEDPDFGIDVCANGASLDNCPQNKRRRLPFVDGLRQLLGERGYPLD